MATWIVINYNSELQFICSLAASMREFEFHKIKYYVLPGRINGKQLILDHVDIGNITVVKNELSIKSITRSYDQVTVISASHFPWSLIRQIGPKRVKKIIRVEEGIGSYGNLVTKVTTLARHGYQHLVFRHILVIIIKSLLKTTGPQKWAFGYNKRGDLNVLFAYTFHFSLNLMKSKFQMCPHRSSLFLHTEKLGHYWQNVGSNKLSIEKYHQ